MPRHCRGQRKLPADALGHDIQGQAHLARQRHLPVLVGPRGEDEETTLGAGLIILMARARVVVEPPGCEEDERQVCVEGGAQVLEPALQLSLAFKDMVVIVAGEEEALVLGLLFPLQMFPLLQQCCSKDGPVGLVAARLEALEDHP